MKTVGIPKEIKPDEFRVAMTPEGVQQLHQAGYSVFVEKDAGSGSGYSDEAYRSAGAVIVESAKEAYSAELVVKVKEPVASEYSYFREGLKLFTFLHLAADLNLTNALLEAHVEAYAYETLRKHNALPLLAPMSEVAGKMAALFGATHLGKFLGGSGRLLGGATGVERNSVLILGGGVAGSAAARVAAGMGAHVQVLDKNIERLHYLQEIMPANVSCLYSHDALIAKLLEDADLIIGTVLIPGAKAPKLVRREHLKQIKKGSVLVDVSIDQGGCFESSQPTTHHAPTFEVDGIVHYCVTNMPGAYPRTSTQALTILTLPYVMELLEKTELSDELKSALNTFNGQLTNKQVAQAHHLPFMS